MPVRTLILGRRHTGRALGAVLTESFRLSHSEVDHALKNRWVRLDGALCRQASQRVRAGQRLQVVIPRQRRAPRAHLPAADLPPVAQAIQIRYIDDQIVVVDKPAGLTTVRHTEETRSFGARAKRFLPATLVDLLPRLLPATKGRIRAVHRLDKATSGLVVLARTAEAEQSLGKQFRAHGVERTYLALVRGRPTEGCIATQLVADRGDGRRGSSADGTGQHAVTHVRVVERLSDFALVECRLETGRTHQVRIHLGERGTPLCGERVYDRPPHGQPIPDNSGAERPMLHAATLILSHPASGKRMAWESDLPADMTAMLAKLRRRNPEG